MNWKNIWMIIFNRTELFGIDMGFWVSMGISALVAILMTVIFWSTKPYDKK